MANLLITKNYFFILVVLFSACSNNCEPESNSTTISKVPLQETESVQKIIYEKYENVIDLDSISVREFMELLKIKQKKTNHIYSLNVKGPAKKNWISKKDLNWLFDLIESKEPAYCVMQVVSSEMATDSSNVGGHVIDLINSYRMKQQYPDFLTKCSKVNNKEIEEIKVWKEKN